MASGGRGEDEEEDDGNGKRRRRRGRMDDGKRRERRRDDEIGRRKVEPDVDGKMGPGEDGMRRDVADLRRNSTDRRHFRWYSDGPGPAAHPDSQSVRAKSKGKVNKYYEVDGARK